MNNAKMVVGGLKMFYARRPDQFSLAPCRGEPSSFMHGWSEAYARNNPKDAVPIIYRSVTKAAPKKPAAKAGAKKPKKAAPKKPAAKAGPKKPKKSPAKKASPKKKAADKK
jgi:hypothetical protein